MNIKRKISKKIILQLAIFAVIIGMATLFDIYFDKNEFETAKIETSQSKDEKGPDTILLISQTLNFGAKTFEQKAFARKVQIKSHDKFMQKYYQLRHYQVLKAEVQTQTAPLINTYHYLVFKNYFYSIPDDIPLIA